MNSLSIKPRSNNELIQNWIDMKLNNNNSNVSEMKYTYLQTTVGTHELKKDFINNSLVKNEHVRGDLYLHNTDEWYIMHSYWEGTQITVRMNGKVTTMTMKDLFNRFKLFANKPKNSITEYEYILCDDLVYPTSIEVRDHDGNFTRVTAIHRHKNDKSTPLIKISTRDGYTAIVTSNHPMFVYDDAAKSERLLSARCCIGKVLIKSTSLNEKNDNHELTDIVNNISLFMSGDDIHVYDITTESNTFSAFGIKCHNCCGLSLLELLQYGYNDTVSPPKHLDSAMPQMLSNFYRNSLYFSGALSYSHVDMLLAPFIFKDKLDYNKVKQIIQNFLFYLDASVFRRGQSLFVNISIDVNVPEYMKDYPVVYGNIGDSYTFSDFQDEMDLFNSVLLDLLIDGKKDNTPFTFPLLTVNYTDDIKNRRCNNEVLNKIYTLTAKYGSPYFRNMTGELKENEEYVHSMCCHLRIDLIDKYKHFSRGLWDIGSSLLSHVGGLNVITINLNRIGIEAKSDDDYFNRLSTMVDKSVEQLMYNRSIIQWMLSDNRYDISINSLDNMFNIISIAGGNESMVNFMDMSIMNKDAEKFMIKVVDFVNDKMKYYSRKYNLMFGLEAAPIERASNRIALKDLELYPNCHVQNKDRYPYITSGVNYPVDALICDIDYRAKIDKKFTSGTVYHIWDGVGHDADSMQKYIEKFSRYTIPYFTYSPVVSICSLHGVTHGIVYKCPKCSRDNYVTAKIVGYCRPLENWSKAKIDELRARISRIECI